MEGGVGKGTRDVMLPVDLGRLLHRGICRLACGSGSITDGPLLRRGVSGAPRCSAGTPRRAAARMTMTTVLRMNALTSRRPYSFCHEQQLGVARP